MSYKALYRVFRPKTFSEVVGQKHIVSVLKNQVKSGQISHAYLFTGSRGTGKTSIAKIFARSISCPDNHDGEACLECKLCQSTLNDTSMDVVEIDAASNNGIDEIRELRDNVKYTPVMGKYKVYIIDEVHMLSAAAFNALLKTLEEPPVHVVFILATTDPQKLPDTIISRCQRYDFERIDREDIADRLEYICGEVKAEADRDALLMIADYAKGGLRDAISLLDQCIAFGDGNVDKGIVLDLLGKSEDETLFKIADMLIDKDGSGLISIIGELVGRGQNPTVLTGEIIEHLRRLMIFKTAAEPEKLLDVVKTQEYDRQSKAAELHMLLRAIKLLSEAMAEMKYSFLPVVVLEVAVMEICTPAASDDNLAVLQRLGELEKAMAEGRLVSAEKKVTADETAIKSKKGHDIQETMQWEDSLAGLSVPPEEDDGAFFMEEPPSSVGTVNEQKKSRQPEREEPAKKLREKKEPSDTDTAVRPEQAAEKPDDSKTAGASSSDTKKQTADGGKEFTLKDYDAFLDRMNKENKGMYVILGSSFFGDYENGVLTIGYPDDSCSPFMNAVEARKQDIIKVLTEMGFKVTKVCVKILKQDKTEDIKKMFGDDIKFID